MTAPQPRRRRKQARPAEIAGAALALFGERGFAATRLEDVAARAGISKATIYLYYPTKADLFRAVVRERLLPLLTTFETAAAHGGAAGSAADAIRDLLARATGLIGSDITVLPKIVLTEAGNFPAIARIYADEVLGRAIPMIEGLISRGIAQGEFRPVDPHATVPLVVAPLLMMVLWKHSLACVSDIAFDPAAVLAAHAETLLRGLAVESRS